jgi:hypothetical protein
MPIMWIASRRVVALWAYSRSHVRRFGEPETMLSWEEEIEENRTKAVHNYML